MGTSEEIFAAYVSAAESQGEEAGLLTIPPEMRPRQGLCERASLTDQDPNFADAAAAIGGAHKLNFMKPTSLNDRPTARKREATIVSVSRERGGSRRRGAL